MALRPTKPKRKKILLDFLVIDSLELLKQMKEEHQVVVNLDL